MRTRLAITASAVAALLLSLLFVVQPAHAETGFEIRDGRLVDANGNDFVFRGVNHPHAWYTGETESFAEIADLGANSVRVVLSSGHRWTRTEAADLANVIAECKANKLICVLEVHDTTGYGEEGAAASLDQAVDYWIDMQDVLAGQEPYVLLNIGNEPWGNTNYQQWTGATTQAIDRLRDAGFDHTIVVDAPNWGQDWSFTMRDNARQIFQSDPAANLIFDVHMYGVYDTAAEIQSYLNFYVDAGLPIMVGEFGHNHSDGNPDEDAILATAEDLGIGYLGWSYSGNGGGVEYLDLVEDFNPDTLTSWGQRLFNGPNGIVETAETASVYDGSDPDPSPSPTPSPDPSPTPDPEAGCTAAYEVVNQWGGGFQGEVEVTADEDIDGWQVTWTFTNGQRITQAWNADVTSSGSAVTAVNKSYNGDLSAGQSTSFGFTGSHSGTNSAPVPTCTPRG
ncbi:mannan endo-1,4-beta-mannosidase [Streptomonospora nanhaiensis]|uniref:Endoglucanase n=1 Tax=Streptomonospora nanhaiensis TaxID=1323731 RepID=A0A853BNV3_9ACTN|nr:cellulase family glycosylhydrolase [Streptomonospora nanhaiensis]NYI97138.1 mannan endo-1,4-beta-mannosidase [Streptomonospora nanhaiensis]